MNALGWRSIGRWGALGFVLTLVLGWPSPQLRTQASEVLCTAVNPLLESFTFGLGGHARLLPRPVSEVRRPGENVTSDSALLLTIQGYRGQMPMGMSLRRDFYLPLCILTAAIVPAPLPWRRRLLALGSGLVLVFALCFVSLWTTSMWLFARLPAGRALSEQTRVLLDTVVGSLIMPPGMHFFAPLLIALFVVWSCAPRGPASLFAIH